MKYLLIILFIISCAGPPSKPDEEKAAQEKPAESTAKEPTVIISSAQAFKVNERQTVSLPGSNDMIKIYMGDITRNYVVTRIQWKQGRERVILAESLREGQTRTLDIDGHKYRLKLAEFDTDGENDFGKFELTPVNQ